MPETRFIKCPALSIDLLGLHGRPMIDHLTYLYLEKIIVLTIFLLFPFNF